MTVSQMLEVLEVLEVVHDLVINMKVVIDNASKPHLGSLP
jgi:hypothetical protein